MTDVAHHPSVSQPQRPATSPSLSPNPSPMSAFFPDHIDNLPERHTDVSAASGPPTPRGTFVSVASSTAATRNSSHARRSDHTRASSAVVAPSGHSPHPLSFLHALFVRNKSSNARSNRRSLLPSSTHSSTSNASINNANLENISPPASHQDPTSDPSSDDSLPTISATTYKPFYLSHAHFKHASVVSADPPKPPTKAMPPDLSSFGLTQKSVSPDLLASRYGVPLCGAILDNAYLLIGSTTGLDFIPLDRPSFDKQGKPTTRRPISLVKRTKFRQIEILAHRSNVLLAISGRNDHVRVYGLDGIRAQIEKKMKELDDKEDKFSLSKSVVEGFARKRQSRNFSPLSESTNTEKNPLSSQKQPLSSPTRPSLMLQPVSETTTPNSRRIRRGRPVSIATSSPSGLQPNFESSTQARHSMAFDRPSPTLPVPDLRASSDTDGWLGIDTVPEEEDGHAELTPWTPTRNNASSSDQGQISRAKRESSNTPQNAFNTPETKNDIFAPLNTIKQAVRSSLVDNNVTERIRHRLSNISLNNDSSNNAECGDGAENENENEEAHDDESRQIAAGREIAQRKLEAKSPTIASSENALSSEFYDFLQSGPPASPSLASSAAPSTSRNNDVQFTPHRDQQSRHNQPHSTDTPSGALDTEDEDLDARWGQSPRSSRCNSVTSFNQDFNLQARPARTQRSGDQRDIAAFLSETEPPSATASSPYSTTHSLFAENNTESGNLADSLANSTDDLSMELLANSPNAQQGFNSSTLPKNRPTTAPSEQFPRLLTPMRAQHDSSSSTPSSSVVNTPITPTKMRNITPRPRQTRESFQTQREERNALIDFLNAGPQSTTPPASSSLSTEDSAHNRRRTWNPGQHAAAMKNETDANRSRLSDDAQYYQTSPTQATFAGPSPGPSNPNSNARQEQQQFPTAPPTDRRLKNVASQDNDGSGETSTRRRRWSALNVLRPSASSTNNSRPSTSYIRSTRRLDNAVAASSSQSSIAQQSDHSQDAQQQESVIRESTESNGPEVAATSSFQDPRRSLTRTQTDKHSRTSSRPLISDRDHNLASPRDIPQSLNGASYGSSENQTPNLHALEYVKLARTKGARLIRAFETRKKTYLAVLCGETGERIELFTGSKHVSLSLNRTFVLPQTPRTIELHMLGDDLLDLFLVYPNSIFALEPSTVRVREVGIGRNERRQARRERERQARDHAALARARAEAADAEEAAGDNVLSQHPRDTVQVSTPTIPTGFNLIPPPSSRPPTSSGDGRRTVSSSATGGSTPLSRPDANASSTSVAQPDAGKSKPYCMFQQLKTVPTVPPSSLASSLLIPPTYESVVKSANDNSGIHVHVTNTSDDEKSIAESAPLLSPISLLLGQQTNPPGLFFVSRGRHTTGIVDADGRSILRQPIKWRDSTEDLNEHIHDLDVYNHIEAISVANGQKTAIVALGPTDVQTVCVDGSDKGHSQPIDIMPLPNRTRKDRSTDPFDSLRDVTFLARHEDIVYWSERIGGNVCIQSVGTKETMKSN